jgi:arsenate reductase (glutaredoxin)
MFKLNRVKIKMHKIIIYEKPTCTTCKKVNKILEEKGVDINKVNYYIEPFTEQKLDSLLKKMNMTAGKLLRKREKTAKSIDVMNETERNIIKMMVQNPDLIGRPIIEMGDKAILARPPERLNELFK